MNNILNEITKKALIDSLYQRISKKIYSLAQKKRSLISKIKNKSDTNKIQKIRENILNQ